MRNGSAEPQEMRTALLLSPAQLSLLHTAHVMIFGLGGVGSYAAEALARMGIGKLTIVDKDVFEESNINRQLGALHSTVGQSKVSVTKARLLDINPHLTIQGMEQFHLPDSPVAIDPDVNLVMDAVDTVAAKLLIVESCVKLSIPVISSMGMGNRLDPTKIRLGDIFETSNCALSRVMRKELRKRGIKALRCVYSTEEAVANAGTIPAKDGTRPAPGSVAYVPSVAGLFMAHDAVQTLLQRTTMEDRH